MLKTKYLKDALPGKLELMDDIFGTLKSGKAHPLDLSRYITRSVPKNINPVGITRPAIESFTKSFTKFNVEPTPTTASATVITVGLGIPPTPQPAPQQAPQPPQQLLRRSSRII